jgi:UDP-N-acetyl-D-glucosamine/UDP-N-acetyl-D-galactosamine dehydrogenase
MNDFLESNAIAVLGLGYVGLPLALEFGKYFDTVGFDIDVNRTNNLRNNEDSNFEVPAEVFSASSRLSLTSNPSDIEKCNIYIVTVPTPIDRNKQPDFTPLINASKLLSQFLKSGDYVIYESTVYPGATENICVPVLEAASNLKFNVDFFVGYSPERINPGDKVRGLVDIKKITSGSNDEVANFVDKLYLTIIKAGTHKAESIKVAEAAKVVENVQRDVNIALANEFYEMFEKMDIRTDQVLKAAATKWNFMDFRPGLVGGHCIGVDPYYLIHQSLSVGYSPKIISSARELNESMASSVVQKFMAELVVRKTDFSTLVVGVFGFSFKEECSDFRNSKVIDVLRLLDSLGIAYRVYDNHVDVDSVRNETSIEINKDVDDNFDVGLLLVPHQKLTLFCQHTKKYIFDFKNILG